MKCGARLYLAAIALGKPLLWPLTFGVAPPTASAIFAAVLLSKFLEGVVVTCQEELCGKRAFPKSCYADRRQKRLQPEMLGK